MSGLDSSLQTLINDFGLVAIFILSMVESACVPIPSEIVVPFGGFLAARGLFPLWTVVLVATAANLTGSLLAYAAGLYGGRAFVLRYGRYVFLSEHHLESAEGWFARRGEVTVLVTRMMPGIRTFISVPAGVARMDLKRFVIYSFIGALLWNLALATLGYAFGENWDRLQSTFSNYNLLIWAVLAVALVAAGTWWWIRRSRSARERAR